jgi:hypothetical protein
MYSISFTGQCIKLNRFGRRGRMRSIVSCRYFNRTCDASYRACREMKMTIERVGIVGSEER